MSVKGFIGVKFCMLNANLQSKVTKSEHQNEKHRLKEIEKKSVFLFPLFF